MGFIQIIEFTTNDIEGVRSIDKEWMAATEGKRSAHRQIVTRDRNDPERYLALVFFDSYESAMENSGLPETQAIAEKYRAATNSTVFHDLEVIADDDL